MIKSLVYSHRPADLLYTTLESATIRVAIKLNALMAGFRKSALISVKIEYG